MIRCIAVDDEQAALDVVVDYINDTPFLELVAATTDAMEASKLLQEQQVDLVFMDVQMPQISGMRFLQLYEGKMKFIMTTGYERYALDSYEYGVMDYLVKPFSYARFLKAVQKMPLPESMKEVKANKTKAPTIKEPSEDFIFVKVDAKGKFQRVNFKEIVYIEAEKTYASIFTNDERIVCNLTLTDLENRLPQKLFLRVHRSYIVALERITAIEGDEMVLKKVIRLPIGSTYKAEVINTFQDSLFFKDRATLVDKTILNDNKE